MKNPKISIIVPIYNVERYILDCLNSIKNQTFTDFECICINDGSPDKSEEIVKKICAEDKRFILINQENGGLSAARNTGVEICKGSWLCFVDSDDIISTSFLEKLNNIIEEYSVDYVSCEMISVPENVDLEIINKNLINEDRKIQITENPLLDILNNTHPFVVSAWAHLYSKELFRNVRFDTMMKMHEDTFVAILLLKLSKKAVHISDKLYFYRLREGSITRSNAYANGLKYLKKNIYLAQNFSSKENLSSSQHISLLEKCGVGELLRLAVSLVLNRNLPKLERYSLFKDYSLSLKKLQSDNVLTIKGANNFIKSGLFISYFLNSPAIFRLLYKIIWRKQWKNKYKGQQKL